MLMPLFAAGCSHTRVVAKHRLADVVLSAPLDVTLKQIDDQYAAIQSGTAFVEIVASTGGALQGQVKDSIAFSGYIILSKPDQIRVILKVPVLGSKALDMVSDGKNFKMLIPSKNCAIVGSDVVTNTSQKGLYSLRPGVIYDSMLVRGLGPDEIVSRTQDIRVIENPKKKNDLIEEPDYDIELLSQPRDRIAHTVRVLHISRADLKPYRQDIYDAEGKVATQAFYSEYQKFDGIDFPTKIVIQRPLDELALTISITRGTSFNKGMPDDEFKLDIPSGVEIHTMDDPAAASATPTNPCAAHAPQSPR
jgi:outer membrane lipoprotein-sorting protein